MLGQGLAGALIVPRKASMVWLPLPRLPLRLARLDMMVSGAGLMIGGAVSGSRG